jgi:hypothetical protein
MRTTSNNNNSWAVDLVQTVAPLPDSLADKNKFLELTLALVNVENDDKKQGYLISDLIKFSSQLGISSDKLRTGKGMKTSQLDAQVEELHQQLKERPIKHLSVA